MSKMTYLLELRNIAAKCSNINYRFLLKAAADELAERINLLHEDPTTENMTILNGAWAVTDRILKEIPPEGSPDPMGGNPEPAKLQMVA